MTTLIYGSTNTTCMSKENLSMKTFDNKKEEARERAKQRRQVRNRMNKDIYMLKMCVKQVSSSDRFNKKMKGLPRDEMGIKIYNDFKQAIVFYKKEIVKAHKILSLKKGVAY